MSIIATDLDGTIFKGQTLIDGVKEGLLKIINEGIKNIRSIPEWLRKDILIKYLLGF